ncbi:MAG: NAD(P)H-dependent oxidoreductase subunit E [Phycisphaerales bacterium]
MGESVDGVVRDVIGQVGRDRTRMLDVLRGVQASLGHVPADAVDAIAREMGVPRVDVQSVVGFYAFLSSAKRGRVVIRLCDDILDRFAGYDEVRRAFEAELGIKTGETTPDGAITLERTACIGMCDQTPAAMINEVIVTALSTDSCATVRELRIGDPHRLVIRGRRWQQRAPARPGDGREPHRPRRRGALSGAVNCGEAIRKRLPISPMEVIRSVGAAYGKVAARGS